MADIERRAEAQWTGDLKSGVGKTSGASGAFEDVQYTFATRFENKPGSNPEELIGAAHASCFSMQLSGVLTGDGNAPKRIHTRATVTMRKVEGGFKVSAVHLHAEGEVPGIDEATFKKAAEEAKEICPISVLLSPGLEEVTVEAKLL